MSARAVLAEATARGVRLCRVGDRICWRASELPPPDLLERLRQHRDELAAMVPTDDEGLPLPPTPNSTTGAPAPAPIHAARLEPWRCPACGGPLPSPDLVAICAPCRLLRDPAAHVPDPDEWSCRACASHAWWRRTGARTPWICATCHPPVAGLAVETVLVPGAAPAFPLEVVVDRVEDSEPPRLWSHLRVVDVRRVRELALVDLKVAVVRYAALRGDPIRQDEAQHAGDDVERLLEMLRALGVYARLRETVH